jgi:hypothetical protein
MKGLSTEEILSLSLKLANMSEVPPDSGIHVPGENIKKLIFAMDVNVGLLHLAKQMGFDAVVGHHPCGVLLHRGEVYRRHIDLLEMHGIPREKSMAALAESIDTIVRRMENTRFRMLHHECPNQTVLEVDAARMLDLAFLNIHNPFDEAGRKILQGKIDEASSKNPRWKLKDVLALIGNLPEARYAREEYGISPRLFIGDPEAEASRVVFVHGALSAPHPAIVQFYWQNGFRTLVVLHGDFESLEKLKSEKQGHLIMTGHFLGDSIGMTPFIREIRQRGLEVVCMGGIIDIQEGWG